MPNKTVKKGRYSQAIREQAAIAYALNGNYTKTGREMDIPKETVFSWSKHEWWDNLIASVHTEKASEHRATYARIVDEAQVQVLATLDQATAAQANIIAATATDKVRLLDNQPTTISSSAQTPQQVADQFMKMIQASDKAIVPKSTIIEHKK